MDTIGTLPNCPYYRGVLSSEVGSKLVSHTPQLLVLTCITETTQTGKRRPIGYLSDVEILISGVLTW